MGVSLWMGCRRRTDLDEVGQQAGPAPARITQSFPSVKVIGATAVPAHGIENAAPTEHFALRIGTSGTVQVDLIDRRQIPVVDATDVAAYELRNLDELLVVVTAVESAWRRGGVVNARDAGFDQQNVDYDEVSRECERLACNSHREGLRSSGWP